MEAIVNLLRGEKKMHSRPWRANGPAIRYYRARAHLTLKQVAEITGVSFTTISRIETGAVQSPRFSTMEAIADALGVEVDQLLIYTEPPNFLNTPNVA
jgi:transcriptional regulator with XRE-family HTH domain